MGTAEENSVLGMWGIIKEVGSGTGTRLAELDCKRAGLGTSQRDADLRIGLIGVLVQALAAEKGRRSA